MVALKKTEKKHTPTWCRKSQLNHVLRQKMFSEVATLGGGLPSLKRTADFTAPENGWIIFQPIRRLPFGALNGLYFQGPIGEAGC